ncbi:MAG: SIR2 family protein [Alphaproteobacteria bacterium]|nr:SIR2 family protein [Alphaproteobacteria bacterium]MCW5743249.1 SIR2 family protein [Alphaproteobacteria bacterium]
MSVIASSGMAPLVARYAKALCHLNYARRIGRLGLILGSGVSDELEIPKWKDLIEGIEQRLNYSGAGAPEAHRAEQLFQHYKKLRKEELGWAGGARLDAAVSVGWRDVVAQCLYKCFLNVDGEFDESAYVQKIRDHPYLLNLGRLAHNIGTQLAGFQGTGAPSAGLVVSHNFDDALEAAIELNPSQEPPSRRYHSFWRPEPFLRRGVVNIYHPNGYTPLRRGLRGSESLVLTEATFADHLANTNTEESNFLLRHLADKTCLIIGHSLADGTLKNALRQHANQRPAHVNYYVHWVRNGESELNDDQRRAIREANFETYNLVTIFASSAEVSELLLTVMMTEDDFEGHLKKHSQIARYVYYVVGAVSSGKSTTLRHLRDLATVEEWPNKMPPIMNRQSIGLKKTEEEEIDEGLEDAIWKKNTEIRSMKVGIVAVDRAPLDFIAFPATDDEPMRETATRRAKAVLGRLLRDDMRDFCAGQVILVRAETEALVQRQMQRGGRTKPEEVANGSTASYLSNQKARLDDIYKDASVIDSDRCSVGTSVKAAARIIHFDDYVPFDFAGRLRAIQGDN